MATRKGRKVVSENVKQGAIAKIRAGAKRADVAKEIGVSMATINNWMAASGGTSQKGKNGKNGKNGKSKHGPSKNGPSDEVELMKLELEFLRKKVAYYENKVR